MLRRLPWALLVTALSAFGGQVPQGYPQSQYPQVQDTQAQYPEGQQQAQSQGGVYPDTQQPPAATANPADDMQHGVARLSIVQGDVNVRRGDNGQLTGAVVNAPLMSSDHLETSPGSRAEVQLGGVDILRLAPNTDAAFSSLQYRRAQIQLGIGTVIYRVLGNSDSQVEIDTPSVGVRALGPGEYRISVFDNGTSQITVRSGELELSGPRGSERLEAGHSVLVRGDANDPEMQSGYEIARDQFDDWSESRDREEMPAQSNSYQYVNADVQGASDLDRNGSWVSSGYGQVWQPQGVGPDWSPYSDGQWTYLDYYGWTWIDAAPWGWAPYHYGRWFWNTGHGWCWWPGARGGYSYWNPALVGFFGWGGRGGIGIGLGFGGLGWVALAPYEIFHPWWGRGGFGYRGGYSLGSFRNAGVRGGALTVGFDRFGGVRQHFAAATRSQITGATGFSGRLPVAATAASYRFSSRPAVANQRLSVAQNRTFFHSQQTFRGGASSFSNSAGRPSVSNRASYPSSAGGVNRAPSSGTGWQRFGSPAPSSSLRQNFSAGSESSGWHSFGQPGSAGRPAYTAPRQNYNYSAPGYQQRYSAPAQRYSAPAQRYSAPAQRYSAPAAPRYNAPAMRSAPAPHYSAPAQHNTAPSGHGGGGSRPSGGGHSSGGGHRGR